MQRLTLWLLIASLTFAAGIAATYWFLYRSPAVQSLELPPCVKPPEYERLAGPCSSIDLSHYRDVQTLSYCDLARNPGAYDGQIISVSGVYFLDKENSGLYSPGCPDAGYTDVVPEPYYDEHEAFERLSGISGFRAPWRVRVTMLGKFSGPDGLGYGHLSGYRFQLSVMALESIAPAPPDVP